MSEEIMPEQTWYHRRKGLITGEAVREEGEFTVIKVTKPHWYFDTGEEATVRTSFLRHIGEVTND